jgi:rhamnosyl/mannosyltransferase
MRAEWTTLASRQQGPARFLFCGEVNDDEMRAQLVACSMFVLPSVTRAEAFGFVQLEAMACGKPVISTALPTGVPWVNQTGLVVPPEDVTALRGAIDRLARDPAFGAAIGAAGEARARADFAMSAMGDRLVDVCQRLANGRSPRST